MFVLSGVSRLYDGTSATPAALHRDVDLYVDAGRIERVVPHDPAAVIGSDHQRVDARGLVATPGLVDCHGHATVLGLSSGDMDRANGPTGILWIERILYTTLVDGGVTTQRDVGGATHLVKRLVDEGVLVGPRLKIAICMLSTTGGHADFRGPDRCHAELSRLWPEAPGRPSSIVDGPWDCRKRVREIAACGADLIKVCASPGVASPRDTLEHREFTAEEFTTLCDEAGARGLRVAAHAHSRSGIELAIRSGVHDLQHVSFFDDTMLELAAKHGCVVTPTSWVIQALRTTDGLDAPIRRKVDQVAEVHARAVAAAGRGGIPVLAGTDPVLPGMHGRNWSEIDHLVRDGLTPLQAWHGMTGLAAREIGQPDAGTLVAGQRADILLFAQDVVEDPARLRDGVLQEVFKDGVAHRGHFTALGRRDFHRDVLRQLRPDEA